MISITYRTNFCLINPHVSQALPGGVKDHTEVGFPQAINSHRFWEGDYWAEEASEAP